MTALVLLLASCHGERAEPESASRKDVAPPAAAASTQPAAATAAQPPVSVHDAAGAEALSVRESGGNVEIAFTDAGQKHSLRGDTRDSGKRKYQLDGAAVSYEVKPNDEGGFKLRTPDGKLRWKVKVSPEKIKISDNEENNNPYELKVRDGDRVKVVAPGDREVGNVRFDRGKSKIEVENAAGRTLFSVDRNAPAGAFGVLLLDAIPRDERYILMAEILSRGR